MGEVLPGELGRGGGAEGADNTGDEQRGAAISADINTDPDCLHEIDQEYCGDHSRPRRAPPECDCSRKKQALDQNLASDQKPKSILKRIFEGVFGSMRPTATKAIAEITTRGRATRRFPAATMPT